MALKDDVPRIKELVQHLDGAKLTERIVALVEQDVSEEQIQQLQEAAVELVQIAEQLHNHVHHAEAEIGDLGGMTSEVAGSIFVLEDIVSGFREGAKAVREQCHDPARLAELAEFRLLPMQTDDLVSYVDEPRYEFLEAAIQGDFSADSGAIEARNAALLKDIDDRATFSFWTVNGYLFIDPDGDRSSFPLFYTEDADRGAAIMKRSRFGAGKIEVTDGNAAYLEYGISNFSDKKVVSGGDDDDEEE